jgi:hypothetical protein
MSVLYMALHAAFVFRLAGAVRTMKLRLFTTLDLQVPQHVCTISILFPAPRTWKCTWKLILIDIFGAWLLRLLVSAYHNIILYESLQVPSSESPQTVHRMLLVEAAIILLATMIKHNKIILI